MALIDDAFDYLNITWDDPALKRKLTLAMTRGEALIDDYAGKAQDYETPGEAQGLLFDYLRYVRSDATEMFEQNYIRDLLRLRRAMIIEAASDDEDEEEADS